MRDGLKVVLKIGNKDGKKQVWPELSTRGKCTGSMSVPRSLCAFPAQRKETLDIMGMRGQGIELSVSGGPSGREVGR